MNFNFNHLKIYVVYDTNTGKIITYANEHQNINIIMSNYAKMFDSMDYFEIPEFPPLEKHHLLSVDVVNKVLVSK